MLRVYACLRRVGQSYVPVARCYLGRFAKPAKRVSKPPTFLGEGLKTRGSAVCGAEWGARCCVQRVRNVALLAAFAMFRHVLKIPRKGSIVVPCFALCCLFAFIWHLSLTLSVA